MDTTILLIISVVIIYVLHRLTRRRQYKLPPGPPGLPIFGNVFQMNRQKPFETYTSWMPKYGDIIRARMLTGDMVVLNSYDMIKEALFTKGRDFASRPQSLRHSLPVGFAEGIAFVPYTEKYRLMKKLTVQAIKVHAIPRLEEISLDIIREMIDGMQTGCQGDASIDPMPFLHDCVSAIMMSMMYGYHPTKKQLKDVLDLLRDTSEVLTPNGPGVELDIFPWLRYFPNKTYDKALRLRERNLEFYPAINNNRKTERCPQDPVCMLDALFDGQESETDALGNPVLLDTDILGITIDVIRAGTITNTVTLNALVVILVNHPDVQDKMAAEIDRKLGTRMPKLSDRDLLPYTEAVILETLRYTAVSPLGVPRSTTVDTTLGGYDIPKGTKVLINVYNLHHDNRYWDNPWEFRPERFLNDDGTLIPNNHVNMNRLLPFLGGARNCPEKRFSRYRIFLILVSLLQTFRFLPEEDGKMPPCDPRTYSFGIVIRPQDYKVRLRWS